MGPEIHII